MLQSFWETKNSYFKWNWYTGFSIVNKFSDNVLEDILVVLSTF